MGVVCKARQFSLDRLVAHEMLRPGTFPSPDKLVRLRDEALALADDGSLTLLRLPGGEVAQRCPPHRDAVTSLAALPDGQVASASRDGTVRLWRLRGEQLVPQLTLRHSRAVLQVAWALGGARLLVLERGTRGARVWHLDRLLNRLGDVCGGKP